MSAAMAALHRRRDQLAREIEHLTNNELACERAIVDAEDLVARNPSKLGELENAEKRHRQARAMVAAARRRLASLDARLVDPAVAEKARALEEAAARAGTVGDFVASVQPDLDAIAEQGKQIAEAWKRLARAVEDRVVAWSEAASLAHDFGIAKPPPPAAEVDVRVQFRNALARGLRAGGLEPMSSTAEDLLAVHYSDPPRLPQSS